MGLGHSEEGKEESMAKNIDVLTKDLKTVILVQNNGMPGSVPILLKLNEKK